MTASSTAMVEVIGWTLVHFVWQGVIIAATLGFVTMIFPRGWARARYLLACLALLVMAGAPLVTGWRLASGSLEHGSPAPATVWADPPSRAESVTSPHPDGFEAAASAETAERHSVSMPWLIWVVIAWMAGVAVSTIRLSGGWMKSRQLVRREVRPAEPSAVELVQSIACRLGVRRAICVLETSRIQVPAVAGALRPVLLLPISALAGLPPRQLEALLAHEVAHIARHDYLVNLLQSTVETVLFYHPCVWWVSHTIRVEREHCCDDMAVSACGDRITYARALTTIETIRSRHTGLALGASDGSLVSRVRRLMGASQPRGFASSGWAVATVTVIMVAGAGASGWIQGLARVVADASDSAAGQARAVNPRTTFTEVHTPPVPPAPPAPPAPPVGAAPSAPSAPSAPAAPSVPAVPSAPAVPQVPAVPAVPAVPPAAMSIGKRDGTHVWKWSRNGIAISLRSKGRVEFTEDDSDVRALDPGGSFEVVEGAGWFSWSDRSKFEAYAKSDGTIVRRYFADGKELTAEEGRRWLKTFLPRLLREAAIGADTRVGRWLKQSGPDGVLREVSRIESDSARHVYFTHLFEQAQLDSPTLVRALQQAGREISSDFEHGVVLKRAAARFALDEVSASAFAESSRHVGSDFEQRHALAAALEQPTLPAGATAGLLKASVPSGEAGIGSDFELAELLIQAPAGVPEKAGAAFFDALNTVESDFEHHKVLKALMSRRGLPQATLDAALRSALGIQSDFEQATLLIEAIQSQGLPEPRQPFYDAVRTIQSDFERKRVLSAVSQRPGLVAADIAAVANLVDGMSSDFERAEVLLALVGHRKLSDAERAPVLGAAERIGSDHERGRVLSAMLRSGALGSATSSR